MDWWKFISIQWKKNEWREEWRRGKHEDRKDDVSHFIKVIRDTIKRKGNVIIPSFAVGRTQEVIYEQASSRFRDHFDSSKLLCKQLLDSDDKLVSRVCNNTRREKKNKYLFTPTLIEETIKNTQMNFPNEMALLWGNEDEIKEYIYSLFC